MTIVLTQQLKTAARYLLAQAIEAEISDYLVQFQIRCEGNGRAVVASNGHQPEGDIHAGIGPVEITSLSISTEFLFGIIGN